MDLEDIGNGVIPDSDRGWRVRFCEILNETFPVSDRRVCDVDVDVLLDKEFLKIVEIEIQVEYKWCVFERLPSRIDE